jgi:predicted metalloprotease with PDZ domain
LLWVYEGQTEFWALVLAARAGQLTPAQALDILALDAAVAEARIGRSWKSLEDSNNDPLYDAGHPVLWRDWQRREDYYGEGVLLWLDVDTLLEERTSGKRSLADFVEAFFGDGKSNTISQTYTFGDLCAALNQVAPLDWQRFLQTRLGAHDDTYLLDGLKRAGYRLVFTAKPSEAFRQEESEDGVTNLSWSIGLTSTPTGTVKAVTWRGPAFTAGIGIGTQIKKVNGQPYTAEILQAAVANTTSGPLQLEIVADGQESTVRLEYRDGLRYPQLQRIEGTQDLLLPLFTARRLDALKREVYPHTDVP